MAREIYSEETAKYQFLNEINDSNSQESQEPQDLPENYNEDDLSDSIESPIIYSMPVRISAGSLSDILVDQLRLEYPDDYKERLIYIVLSMERNVSDIDFTIGLVDGLNDVLKMKIREDSNVHKE